MLAKVSHTAWELSGDPTPGGIIAGFTSHAEAVFPAVEAVAAKLTRDGLDAVIEGSPFHGALITRLRQHCQDAGAGFADVSADPAEAAQLLEIRRLAYPAAERLGQCLVEDVGVPRSKLPALMERIEQAGREHDVTILTVAHAGDGNAHPTFVFDRQSDGQAPASVWAAADDIFRAALELGGTLTGEHGVGALKRRWLGLEVGDDVLDVHRSIKQALDPQGILNPGKGF